MDVQLRRRNQTAVYSMDEKRRTAPEEGTNEPFADKDYAHLFF